MAELVYRIRGLKKEYADRVVVDIEQLDIHTGEFLVIVGPSGAGKSTLLRLLNFLEPPTSGEIYFQDQLLGASSPLLEWRRRVTTVFQRPILLRARVRENIVLGLSFRDERADDRIEKILARVGLSAFAQQPAHKLSGGELQRVALARALVINPSVLLLDEPTANLDPYNVGMIEEIVREHNRAQRTTVVLVTHNIFQARRLGTRVGLMLGGRLIEVNATNAFFNSASDPRTAAFVRGEMIY
ncbi:MAG: ATP-binding cassette domain-containing protein [Chloroflexi bacterium]|nr:ATP-binding cassette domain-containing protein [Chloroflexota bacterium]